MTEPIVIILDALDEFGTSKSRAPLLQLLSAEFNSLPRRARFLITSRPEADLVLALSSKPHICEAKLDIDTEASRHDVSLYISTRMKELVPAKSAQGSTWDEMM